MKISAQWVLVLFAIALGFNACAMTYYVNVSNSVPVAPYANWLAAATNIQDAIDASSDGDLIWVTNGLYNTGGRLANSSHTGGGVNYATPITNRVVINKAVAVRSVNGPAVTVIQGYHFNFIQTNSASATNYNNDLRGVYLTNNATLDGFTVTGGGGTGSGSGVNCESTNCFLTNCVLTGNVCAGNGSLYGGAGVYQGTLNNCVISNNLMPVTQWNYDVHGGGAYKSLLNNCLIVSNNSSFGGGAASSTLNNCTIIGNSAPNYGSPSYGGGTFQCVANNCLLSGNYCSHFGGGIFACTLVGCVVSNNSSSYGGGCYLHTGVFPSSMINCLVVSNYSSIEAGGIDYAGNGIAWPYIINCTVVGNNTKGQYGGTYGGTNINCIIYYNTPNNCPNATANNSHIIYCCTTPMPFSSTGDTTNEPAFINLAAGDFHLQSNSPCINAGKNSFVTSTNDLDGNPRIVSGTVDIGAYEYQAPASIL